MSLLAQTDTAMPKKGPDWTDFAPKARLIGDRLSQDSTPLVSAMPSILEDGFNNSTFRSLHFPKDAEALFAYSSPPITYPHLLFDHLCALLRDRGTAFSGSAETAVTLGEDTELTDALADLRASPSEAREEGLPIPSRKALQNAEHILREMYGVWPRRFEVYPMPKGEIAIDAPSGTGSSVIVLCDSQGGALCSVNLKGGHRRAYYSDAQVLPDGFLRDAISDMMANVRE